MFERIWLIVLGIIFIIMIGIAGNLDYQDELEIQKQKEELKEYLEGGYEID